MSGLYTLSNFYVISTLCEMPDWASYKLESRLLGRNINNLRYADTTLMKESKEELKSLWIRVKEESGKSWEI